MPRNGSGTYTLPLAPVVTQTTIESTWANTTTQDLRDALTDSLSRSGDGGMLGAFELYDGTKALPGATFTNEVSSGLYREVTGDIRLSVLGVDAVKYLGDGANVLTTNNVATAITASATQAQGQQPLTSSLNIVTVVGVPNDVVTLPTVEGGLSVRVVNNGANVLQVFPASGDDLGAGLNTSETLGVGATKVYCGVDATNWSSNTITINDLIATSTTDSVSVATGALISLGGLGIAKNMYFGGSAFGSNAQGPKLNNTTGSSTAPTLVPNYSYPLTGIGGVSNEGYLISNSNPILAWKSSGVDVTGALSAYGGQNWLSRVDSSPSGSPNSFYNDLVLGSTGTAATGMTFLGSTQSAMAFGDVGDPLAGVYYYYHFDGVDPVDEHRWQIGGTDYLTLSATALTLTGDLTAVSGTGTFSKDDSTPVGTANSAVNDCTFGSTDTANTGITIFGSGQGGIAFGDVADPVAGQFEFQHSTDSFDWYIGGTKYLNLDATELTVTGNISASAFIYSSITASITASTTQTQAGGTALTAEINAVSVCDNTNDTVVLPEAQAGKHCYISNRGAQVLQIFPAVSDNIDNLTVNVPVTLAVGSKVHYFAINSVSWESV